MSDNKLFDLLSTMDTSTLQRFRDFIFSPFHNKNQRLQQLLSYIEKSYPDLKTSAYTKKGAYRAMYGSEKYNDAKLRAMASMLSKLAEDFLAINRFKNDRSLYDLLLLDALQQLGTDKYYNQRLRKMYAQQELSPLRDIEFHFYQHQLEQRNYNFAVSKKEPHIGKSLGQLIQDLDTYYFASRLKFSCELLNRKNILGEEHDLKFLEALQKLLQSHPSREVAIVNVYFQIVQLFLESEKEAHFSKLLQLLEKHSHQFPPAENKVIYGYAMNYCIRKINIGKEEYQQMLFRLYELLIKHESILEGKFLSEWDYKNIVTVALRLEKIDWTENFINSFKDKLHPSVRGNAYKYNLANLNYFRKKFDKTLLLLREVEFTDMSYELSSKTLLLKSYFELNEFEALFNHADTFKLFLRRNKKISDYQKTIYKNLIRYIGKLAKLKSMRQKIPKKLLDEITLSKDIADKTWLLNKVA